MAPTLRRIVLAGLLTLAAHASAEEIGTPPLQLNVSDSGALLASGRWITKIRRGNNFPLAAVNSVQLTCARDSMTCIESRAELAAANPESKIAASPPHSLVVRSVPFRVTEWSDSRLIARTDTPSADLMLTVDLVHRQVELSWWDTQPGAKPGTAEGFVWVLR
jgi:hypothetical protein